MSLGALSQMVKRKLPANIYRCKGVVYAAEADGRRAILQVAGRRADLALENEWGGRSRRSQIVAIGAPGSIDDAELTALSESCIVMLEEAPHPS